jgi:hypothetical protein
MKFEEELEKATLLTDKFLLKKNNLSFANIGLKDEYLGWVNDFRVQDSSQQPIGLDLTNNNDLFLLFVLAVVWSRPGQWENSVYFVSYLKLRMKNEPEFWVKETNYLFEEEQRKISANLASNQLFGIIPRKQIAS